MTLTNAIAGDTGRNASAAHGGNAACCVNRPEAYQGLEASGWLLVDAV